MKTILPLLILFVSSATFANTYYVATTGNDANVGTLASPWLTIQKAANTVSPGDAVLVQDGTYSCPSCTGVGSGMVNAGRGGTASAYVTFQSQNKWGAVLDGLNNTTDEGFKISASYIRIKDFDIKGFAAVGVDTYPGGQFINIVGNHIHDIGRYCTSTGIGRDAIFISHPNVTIEQNTISDIGRYAPNENGCVNPTNYQANDHGIYMASGTVSNIMIRNNLFYRVEHGFSVQVYPDSVAGLSILNNTFVWCDAYGQNNCIIIAGSTGSTGLRIENNIVYDPVDVLVRFYAVSGYSGTVANNFIYQGAVSDITPAGITFLGNIRTNPLLVSVGNATVDNASIPDAHLTSTSPAINAGLTLTDVTNDYAGVSRPQGVGIDIGAFEFLTGSAAPNPPTNLTVTVQ